MNFAEIIAKLPDTERNAVVAHIEAQITDAVNKAIEPLNGEITALKAAQAPPADPTAEAIKDLPADVKAILQNSLDAKKAAEEALAKMETEKAIRAFKDTLAVFGNLPIEDKHVEALYALSQSNPENFKDLEQILKVANEAMGKGFTATGKLEGKDQVLTAYDEIQNRVTKLMNDNSELDYNEAFKQVVAQDPALYDLYRDERPAQTIG